MNYQETIKTLNNIYIHGMNLNLDNIKSLLKKLNNPQNNLKYIHIAGTNGKGSTAAMLSSILNNANIKVGLYTSPHLIEPLERFRINEIDIKKEEFTNLFHEIYEVRTNETYFEILTALAFLYFQKNKVDLAILETGLGGRFDATNIITPLVSIITPISLEHQKYLGNTIEKIASEKAGIIKQNIPTITNNDGKALEVIKKKCMEMNSQLFLINNNNKLNNIENFKNPNERNLNYETKIIETNYNLEPNLIGLHQKQNAQLAIQCIKLLENYKITKNNIETGLKSVKWPARIQKINNKIFDCAHNPHAINSLVQELNDKKYNLLIGILKDKDYKEMIKSLASITKKATITKPHSNRALEPKLIKDEFNKYNIPTKIIKNSIEAYEKSKPDLVTGSIYLVGEILKHENFQRHIQNIKNSSKEN